MSLVVALLPLFHQPQSSPSSEWLNSHSSACLVWFFMCDYMFSGTHEQAKKGLKHHAVKCKRVSENGVFCEEPGMAMGVRVEETFV